MYFYSTRHPQNEQQFIVGKDMNTQIDLRHTPRIPMNWLATILSAQTLVPIVGKTEDIGVNGALIVCSGIVESIAGEFQIVLKFSKKREMLVTAKKIWSKKIFPDNFNYFELGSIFTKISPYNQNLIASLILEHID